ncbi:uncharacterized protein [Cherax quadricarinatus]|uniref:uncharacterized protein n=1 Tax=Cherax quadricarinatus TaxID=27406 RepID=UPI00387E4DBF
MGGVGVWAMTLCIIFLSHPCSAYLPIRHCQVHQDCYPGEYCKDQQGCTCQRDFVREPGGACLALRRAGEPCLIDQQCSNLDHRLLCYHDRCHNPHDVKRSGSTYLHDAHTSPPTRLPIQAVEQTTSTPAKDWTSSEPAKLQTTSEPNKVWTTKEPARVRTANEPARVRTANEPARVRTTDEPARVRTTNEPARVRTSASGFIAPALVCLLIFASFTILIFTTAYHFRLRRRRLEARGSAERERGTPWAVPSPSRAPPPPTDDAPPPYSSLTPPSYEQATQLAASLALNSRVNTGQTKSDAASVETAPLTRTSPDRSSGLSYGSGLTVTFPDRSSGLSYGSGLTVTSPDRSSGRTVTSALSPSNSDLTSRY